MNLDSISLRQLQIFATVVETGNFTRAAGKFGLTTPAVSVAIKNIDTAIGGATMRRSKHEDIELTPLGAEVLKLAKSVESLFDLATRNIVAVRSGKAGSVRVGVVSTAKYVMPPIIKSATLAFPEIDIDLFVGNRGEILTALNSRSIDFAIMGRPPRQQQTAFERLAPHHHVLIGSPELAAAQSLRDISQEALLLREDGSGTRILFERYLNEHASTIPMRRKTLNSNETIKQAAAAGLGVGLISAACIDIEIASETLIVLNFEGLPIVRDWYRVWLDSHEITGAAEAIGVFISEQASRLMPQFIAE